MFTRQLSDIDKSGDQKTVDFQPTTKRGNIRYAYSYIYSNDLRPIFIY